MTTATNAPPGLINRMSARVIRRSVARSAAAGSAPVTPGHAEMLRAATQAVPAVSATVNALITLEAFVVTLYGAARGRGEALAFDDETKPIILANQCEDEAHYHFFEAAGAISATTTFTVTDAVLSSPSSFFSALAPLGAVFVGAYMSAARQFAAQGNMRLVEIAYQIGAVEAQHHAIARMYAGEKLGSDRAFAKWMFNSPGDALTALSDLGYVDGNGEEFDFPGPVDRYCRGVTGLVAETTEDQPPPLLTNVATPTGG